MIGREIKFVMTPEDRVYPWKQMRIGDCFRLNEIEISSAHYMRRRAEAKHGKSYLLCWVGTRLYVFHVEDEEDGYWRRRIIEEYGIADGRQKYLWDDLEVGQSFEFPVSVSRKAMSLAVRQRNKRGLRQYKLVGNRCKRIR